MATTYRDPKTDWLYRVSPQPDKGGLYKLQYLDQHNSALFKTLPGAYEGGTNFELVSDVLAARAAKEGWVECDVADDEPEEPNDTLAVASPSELTAFDYSGLDAQTVATLHSAETMIRNARKDYIIKLADAVGMAHDELCGTAVQQLDNGQFAKKDNTFYAWCASQGISRSTAYNLLQVSNLLDKSTPNEQKILEQAPTTLLYAAAKPSAPAEAVAAVKSGDVKSMPEYKALLAEIEAERAAREKAEEAQAAAEQEAAEISETAINEMRRANAAEEKVRELESRPIETTATDADELDRLATEKAQTMTEMYKAQITCMQEQNDDLARQLEGSDVERYNHARDIVDAFILQIKAFRESFWRIAGPLSEDDFNELMDDIRVDSAMLAQNDWSDFEEE